MVTLMEGIVARVPEGTALQFNQTCMLTQPTVMTEWLVPSAAACDVVIACMGISPMLEGEEGQALLSD